MNKTKIEWADSTWNPVTGCLNGCEYCYARRIANRFAGCDKWSTYGPYHQATWKRLNPKSELDKALFEIYPKCPPINIRFDPKLQKNVYTKAPYPWGFQPTLHSDRLNEPQSWKKPKTIFVCSMADLFGEWVPDKWIYDVFEACNRFPQHRYLFLTKNIKRYIALAKDGWIPDADNFWYGTTVTNPEEEFFYSSTRNTFLSMEPLLEPFGDTGDFDGYPPKWIIIGAMTGPGSKQHQPKQEWINEIVETAIDLKIPVFMKDSLIPIVGEENMRREFPWEVKR